MDNIDQLLEHNYEQLDLLKRELTKLSEIKNKIDELIGSNDKLPVLFSESLLKVVETSKEYSTLIDNSVNLYLKVNNELVTNSISEFSKKIIDLEIEINRLIPEITRLSKIDLEEHFNKHQNKLSEIFIAINGINTIIANISQNINLLIQKFGEFEQTLSKNQIEINQKFELVKENQEKTTNDLLNKLKESDTKLDAIVSQNEQLKKELDFNKKLNFAIIVLVIISIIAKFI